MFINPVSSDCKVINFKDHTQKAQTQRAKASTESGDVFIKNQEQKETHQLSDVNEDMKRMIRDLRSKKSTPKIVADRFIELLKDKRTMAAFQQETALIDTTEPDKIDTRKVESFYRLTYELENKLDDTLKDRNKNPLIFMFLEPFDNAYENYQQRLSEIFDDLDDENFDEDERLSSVDLNALVDIDDENATEEETRGVLTNITQALKDMFKDDPEPSFDISITIGDDYDEAKYINACKNLFKLVTMTRENSQNKDK